MRFLAPPDKDKALDRQSALDYGSAVAQAVAWLGDRYLLATPVRRLADLKRGKTEVSVAADAPASISSRGQLTDGRAG